MDIIVAWQWCSIWLCPCYNNQHGSSPRPWTTAWPELVRQMGSLLQCAWDLLLWPAMCSGPSTLGCWVWGPWALWYARSGGCQNFQVHQRRTHVHHHLHHHHHRSNFSGNYQVTDSHDSPLNPPRQSQPTSTGISCPPFGTRRQCLATCHAHWEPKRPPGWMGMGMVGLPQMSEKCRSNCPWVEDAAWWHLLF